jgi:hypothetical protein
VDTLLFRIISAITAILVLITWIRPETFRFLLDRGEQYPSQGRQAQHTALMASTWVLVALTINAGDGVPEFLFTGYMVAWAGAAFGSIWLKLKGQREQQDGTVTTKSSAPVKGESP